MDAQCRNTLLVAVAATALMAITVGSRSAFGLFVSPINTATGLGVVAISLAGAVGQLVWGLAQPAVGWLADRHGPARVVAHGALLLALATALVPFAASGAALVACFALMAAAGAAVGSNALLVGVVSRSVCEARRGLAVGTVAAGGSLGQLLLAPATQAGIAVAGWDAALFGLAALALLAVPLALALRTAPAAASSREAAPVGSTLGHPMFLCLAGAFFVCGFHVSFLLAHMPGVIALCGLPAATSGLWLAIVGACNIVGSLAAGLWLRRGSPRKALMLLYVLRAAGVALFMLLPKSEAVVLGFAAWMGLTYMAVLPPMSALLGRLFGLARLATLLGVMMLVHQLGAFLGVWLGGLALAATGSFDALWLADIALALVACALHAPLREAPAATARPARRLATA